jgi:hypothetical protein
MLRSSAVNRKSTVVAGRLFRRVALIVAIVGMVLMSSARSATPAAASGVVLSPVGIPFTNPISVDYHAPTNKIILSANYPTGEPHNFDLVAADGTFSQFSTAHGQTDEVYVAAPRTTANGFLAGQLYTGNGTPGDIVRISPDGSVVTDPWVTLPSEGGLLRGGLHIDDTGVWGGDLIVGTTTGDVWRVTAAGVSTFVGSVPNAGEGVTIEGITTIPNNPKYGPWAGKILAGSDGPLLYTFTPSGFDQSWDLGFSSTENLNVIPANEDFYGVDFADGQLVRAGAGQWTGMVGDIALGEENGNLWDVRWDGSSFVNTLLAQIGQFEGATFAPVSLPPADPLVSARGKDVSATEGQSVTATVATFTDPDPSATPGEYTATIDWGDGSPVDSTATIAESEGTFFVSGTHTYTEEGKYPIKVVITDSDNPDNTVTTSSSAIVGDASLTAVCAASPFSPQSFSGATATFTDTASPSGTLSDFSATINWGDGSSAGTVSGPDGGPYTVKGSHTYSSTGTFTITTKITDVGGQTTKASCTVLVFAFAPGGGSFVIGDKESAVGTAVTFWSAQWATLNPMSGGSGPSAFKGFAAAPATPACGAPWSTDPGNSTPPPAGPLPQYMAVIVSSKAGKTGSTISGDTAEIVIVKTNPGYTPDPGHAGTGTVQAILCPLAG